MQPTPLLTHLKTKRYIKALVKGEPDTRKTSALVSFPGSKLWLDTDRKAQSMVTPIEKDLAYGPIDVIEPESFPQIEDILKLYLDHCPYDIIALDCLTTLVEMELSRIIDEKRSISETRQKTRTFKDNRRREDYGRVIAGIGINTLEDYKIERAMLNNLINLINKLPCHFFLIAHVIRYPDKDAQGTSRIKRQILTGGPKLTASLPGRFNEIWHFQKEVNIQGEEKYIVNFSSTQTDIARTTLGISEPVNFTGRSFYKEVQPYLDLRKRLPKELKIHQGV